MIRHEGEVVDKDMEIMKDAEMMVETEQTICYANINDSLALETDNIMGFGEKRDGKAKGFNKDTMGELPNMNWNYRQFG